MHIEYKKWDSSLLGRTVGEVVIGLTSTPLMKEDLMVGDYVVAKIRSVDFYHVRDLEEIGFRYLETYFKFGKAIQEKYPICNDIRIATDKDLFSLYNISNEFLTMSRYHRDPYLSEEIARNVYREWIKNAVNKVYGDCAFVYTILDGGISGFTTCRLDGRVGYIDLTASFPFLPHSEDSNSCLLQACNNFFLDNNCEYIVSGTQSFNHPSISLLSRNGFSHIDTYTILSWSKDDNKITNT